jgi:hypothetical protein
LNDILANRWHLKIYHLSWCFSDIVALGLSLKGLSTGNAFKGLRMLILCVPPVTGLPGTEKMFTTPDKIICRQNYHNLHPPKCDSLKEPWQPSTKREFTRWNPTGVMVRTALWDVITHSHLVKHGGSHSWPNF